MLKKEKRYFFGFELFVLRFCSWALFLRKDFVFGTSIAACGGWGVDSISVLSRQPEARPAPLVLIHTSALFVSNDPSPLQLDALSCGLFTNPACPLGPGALSAGPTVISSLSLFSVTQDQQPFPPLGCISD